MCCCGGEMLIYHRQQRNRARRVVSDTAHDDLIAIEVVAVDLNAEFFAGVEP
jgi:hypothetical protein